MKISKTIGKTKETKTTKEVKGKTIKNHRDNKNKETKIFNPMSAKVDMGLKVLVSFVLLFSRWFLIVFVLASLVVLVSLVFPMVFDVSKLFHCMFKHVLGNN